MLQIVPMELKHIDGIWNTERTRFDAPWSKEELEKDIKNNPMAIYYVALLNGEEAGYCGMWHVINEGEVTNIAVNLNFRRKGIGRMLLKALIDEGEKRNMLGITLEVHKQNIPAINLYESMGFKAEGFRPGYYADGEGAIIMWKYFREYEK